MCKMSDARATHRLSEFSWSVRVGKRSTCKGSSHPIAQESVLREGLWLRLPRRGGGRARKSRGPEMERTSRTSVSRGCLGPIRTQTHNGSDSRNC